LRFAPLLVATYLVAASLWVPPSPTPYASPSYDCAGSSYRADTRVDYIRNGGFENGFQGWISLPGTNPPTLSSSLSHSGSTSARVAALDGTATHANQSLPTVPSLYLYSFWLYIESRGPGGHFAFELIRNWVPSAGSADIAGRVFLFPGSGARMNAWISGAGGASQDFSIAPATGTWHSFQVVVDGARGVQCLVYDGTPLGTLSVGPGQVFLPTIALFGDISIAGDAGIAYYDDLSLLRLEPALPDLVVAPADVSLAPAPPLTVGTAATVGVTVRNEGDAAARGFNVTAFVDLDHDRTPGAGESLGAVFVSALDVGGSANLSASWTPPTPGVFDVCGIADPDGAVAESNESNNVACLSVEVRLAPTVCPHSQGYWKTHEEAWPVDSLVLGNRTYAKTELLALLRTPSRVDASLILARQLIAAKLNALVGSDVTWIQADLAEADALLAAGPVLPQGVPPPSPTGQWMVAVASVLDAFNNGTLSPGC